MDNHARNRAKEHFPAVLLTLLSIVQAIALELLWSHVIETTYLYEWTLQATVGWVQIATTLMTIVLVWVVYASNVMRFRWVPAATDSIYPFMVGILEFWLVESLGTSTYSLWFLVAGLVFAGMTWIAQITMRRARYDPDNAQFFSRRGRATIVDFYPQIAVFCFFVGFAALIALWAAPLAVIGIVVLATLILMSVLLHSSIQYWNASMADQPTESLDSDAAS